MKKKSLKKQKKIVYQKINDLEDIKNVITTLAISIAAIRYVYKTINKKNEN